MDYKKIGNEVYIRIDKGEELVSSILAICKRENINTAHFSGIGGCGKVVLQTYVPSLRNFTSHLKTGSLEMLSLDGNISPNNLNDIVLHAHATFSYIENDEVKIIGGHLKEAQILYTAEIILTPAKENISRMYDKNAQIDVWDLA